MKSRTVLCAVIVAAGGFTLHAQQAADVQVSDTVRRQVAAFERALRGAVDSAATQLDKRVKAALPDRNVALRFQTDAIVTGVWMPDGNAVFHLLIPAIEQVDLTLLNLWLKLPPPSGMSRVTNAAGGTVGATGLVVDDPATPPAPPLTDPDKEYTEFTRAALIDALLDGALALPIPADRHLTVVAGELVPLASSPFGQRSRILILQISGEDLLALRQNRISRDEAKTRIRQSRY